MATGTTGPDGSIGRRIAQARFALAARQGQNVTQAWLAAQVGVSGPTVSQWESGVTEPALSTIPRIAKALGVKPSWIAFGENGDPTDVVTPNARKLTDAEIQRAHDVVAAKATKRKRG